MPREIEPPAKGKIISLPQVRELHYRYLRAASERQKSKQQQVAAGDRHSVEAAIHSSNPRGRRKLVDSRGAHLNRVCRENRY